MGSGSTDAADESGESAASATGPDWGQVALVLVAAAILALAAVTIPPLGGVGLQGQGPAQPAGDDAPSQLAQLISGGDQQLESAGNGGNDGSGDLEEPGSSDGEGSGSLEGDAETDADSGQSGEMNDGGSEPGSDAESEFGDETGDRQGDSVGEQSGTDAGGDGADGYNDASQGAVGSESGDGSTDEPGDYPDGGSTDSQSQGEGDGTTSDGGDSSGEPTDDPAGDGEADGEGDGESVDGANGETDDASETESDPQESDGESEGSGDGSGAEDGTDSEDEADEDDSEDDEDGTSYDISFDQEPTPGSTVEVTVTGDGEPVESATVYFNDERIGTTDETGTVTGEVPFTERLEVRADVTATETETTTARGSIGDVPATLAGLDSSRQFHGGAVPSAATQDSGTEDENGSDDGNGTRTTVEMNPETNLTVEGDLIAGTNVTLVAEVDGNPIPQGSVTVDGEAYGTTDDEGTAVVSLPETPGNATIAVERGEIRTERTVTVEALSLTVDDSFPLPGRPVDAHLQYGNESVANATVLVDGAAAATTGADGMATVGLPVASEATLEAAYDGARAETTVEGLYRNAALLALAALGGVALLWQLSARYGVAGRLRSLPSPASLLRRIADGLQALGRRAVDAIVRLARLLESLGYWIVGRARAVARASERAGRWLAALPGELATKGLAALAVLHPVRLYRLVRDALRSLFRASRERVDDATETVTGTAGSAEADDESTEEEVRTLRELWAEFVRLVRPPRLRTKTPGEVGRYAVEKGFPEPPVRTVVDAFRDSEYGKATPSRDRLERVRDAVRSVTDDDEDSGAEAVDGDRRTDEQEDEDGDDRNGTSTGGDRQ